MCAGGPRRMRGPTVNANRLRIIARTAHRYVWETEGIGRLHQDPYTGAIVRETNVRPVVPARNA